MCCLVTIYVVHVYLESPKSRPRHQAAVSDPVRSDQSERVHLLRAGGGRDLGLRRARRAAAPGPGPARGDHSLRLAPGRAASQALG